MQRDNGSKRHKLLKNNNLRRQKAKQNPSKITHKEILKQYYAAIKRNEILPFAMMWMELEGIMLSKISQSEKDMYHMTSLI